MVNVFHWKKRPFVYATVLTLGFALLLNILENLPDNFFFSAALILYVVLLFELFSTRFYAQRILDQFELPPVEGEDRLAQLIHHIILPTFTYVGLVIFLFFNHQHSLNILLLVLVWAIFAILFTNIRAYYEDKFKLERITHNVYDFLMLIISFISIDAILNIFSYTDAARILIVLAVAVTLIFLGFLVLIRYGLTNLSHIRVMLGTIIVFAALLYIFLLYGQSLSLVSFIGTLFFYYLIAYFNHVLDDSFSGKVLLEYVLVFSIIVTVLYGIS
jgi:hypothetical protein